MGSAKKQKKKFSKPSHPWQKERILVEKDLQKEYGLRRKYEIWKMNSILKNFTRQAKNLVTIRNTQVEKERGQLLNKLHSLGLVNKDAKIEDILSLNLKNIMERRLQTLVYRKNLANTIEQARQLIVHEHIALGEKKVTSPSYLVPVEEEAIINFAVNSSLADANHPLRAARAENGQKRDKEKDERRRAKDEKLAKPKGWAQQKSNPRTKNVVKQKAAQKTEMPANEASSTAKAVSGTHSAGKEEKTEEAKA